MKIAPSDRIVLPLPHSYEMHFQDLYSKMKKKLLPGCNIAMVHAVWDYNPNRLAMKDRFFFNRCCYFLEVLFLACVFGQRYHLFFFIWSIQPSYAHCVRCEQQIKLFTLQIACRCVHAHDEIWLQSSHFSRNCSPIKHTHARARTRSYYNQTI